MEACFSRSTTARSASNVIYVIDVESHFKSNLEPIKRDGAFQDFVAALDGSDTTYHSSQHQRQRRRRTIDRLGAGRVTWDSLYSIYGPSQ